MGLPTWWTQNMPELIAKREAMHNVEKWQTMYVRYKCQPEAQVTQSGWDLSISQNYADQLALEEQQPYLSEESLLYNGLAPINIALRIIEAPAEYAVPVKQDRRLTPNFKVRVEVNYKGRCSFPLCLKCYVISQHEKDSVPEWVPDDFLDPDLPQRKPITELKGTTVITHHFEGTGEELHQRGGPHHPRHMQNPLNSMLSGMLGDNPAASQSLLTKGVNPSLLAGMGWGGNLDPRMVGQMLQDSQRNGTVDPATAALTAAAQLGGLSSNAALNAFSSALGAAVGPAAGSVDSHTYYDYEFSNVELVKPTRMNKVYLVFACSILEQDLMFVVYNIPTVGICRAEQRVKACQKLGLESAVICGMDLLFAGYDYPLGLGLGQGPKGGGTQCGSATAQQQKQRKRGSSQAWAAENSADGAEEGGGSGGPLGLGDGGLAAAVAAAADVADAAAIAGSRPASGMQMHKLLPAPTGPTSNGLLQVLAASGPMVQQLQVQQLQQLLQPMLMDSGIGAASGTALGADGKSRAAVRALLLEEYNAAGLHRKLSQLDLQALECLAGFPADSSSSQAVTVTQQQCDEFLGRFRLVIKLLRHISNVWNLEDPCVIAGFDIDDLGAAQALALQPPGTFVSHNSISEPGALILTCRVDSSHPNADAMGLLHAVLKLEDCYERRVETWMRDFTGATHILDVYKNKRVDKRQVFACNYTRLRAMNILDAYDDILI